MNEAQQAKLTQWWALTQKIAVECDPLIEQERKLRKELFGELFPTPVEGTNTLVMPDGWQVRGTYPIDRKVDAALVDQLRRLTLVDLTPEMLQRLNLDPAAFGSGTRVLEAMRMNVDGLLNYKPDLVVKAYRELTEEQRLLFDRCLDSKPGSIAMKITPPAASKGKAGEKAAGF